MHSERDTVLAILSVRPSVQCQYKRLHVLS